MNADSSDSPTASENEMPPAIFSDWLKGLSLHHLRGLRLKVLKEIDARGGVVDGRNVG